jgi:hypothetical protein
MVQKENTKTQKNDGRKHRKGKEKTTLNKDASINIRDSKHYLTSR